MVEACVIYAFFRFLLGFMGGRKNLIHVLRHRHGGHMIPFCWLKPWTMGKQFLDQTTYGCLQYVPVKLVLAALTFVLSVADEDGKYYLSGDFRSVSARDSTPMRDEPTRLALRKIPLLTDRAAACLSPHCVSPPAAAAAPQRQEFLRVHHVAHKRLPNLGDV